MRQTPLNPSASRIAPVRVDDDPEQLSERGLPSRGRRRRARPGPPSPPRSRSSRSDRPSRSVRWSRRGARRSGRRRGRRAPGWSPPLPDRRRLRQRPCLCQGRPRRSSSIRPSASTRRTRRFTESAISRLPLASTATANGDRELGIERRSPVSGEPRGPVPGDRRDSAARVDPSDAMVVPIGDVEIAGRVEGHIERLLERGRDGRPSVTGERALVHAGGTAAGHRRDRSPRDRCGGCGCWRGRRSTGHRPDRRPSRPDNRAPLPSPAHRRRSTPKVRLPANLVSWPVGSIR